MDVAEFQEWSGGFGRLSGAQRRQTFQTLALSEASDSYDDDLGECREADAVTAVSGDTLGGTLAAAEPSMPAPPSRAQTDGLAGLGQRRVDSMGCPHCGGREVTLWGKASGVPRYRCKSCGPTFNALTKTPVAPLRKKDKWLEQASALIDGASVSKAAERCDVDYTTAFRWRHRFLEALSLDKPKNLSGIVEGDETFILESFKGKRSGIPRASRRRGGKAAKRGLSAEQIPVIVARDRSGATIDAVLPKLNRASRPPLVVPSRLPTSSAAMAALPSLPSPSRLRSRSTSWRPPASPACKRPIFTSTTSMPIGSKNGCAASMVSPPKISPTIWAGAGPWKHSGRRPGRRTGSSVRSAWGHTNK